ncbi:MAG: hypothetical protein IKB23_07260 [Clostridia bacterium]|nr:hypothetical protein [Clostridia bacterium]
MRKKGFVERIVMSEPAAEDFSPDKLPKNRARLFLYMLKNKPLKIYMNHWLTALFFLPLIVWSVLTMRYTDWLFSLSEEEGITHLVEYWFTVYVSAIPLWVIGFVGLSGGLNVLRKLAWSDPVILKTDFLRGIKLSRRQFALVGLLWGIAYAILRYMIDWLGFYYRVFDNSLSSIFGIFLFILLLLVLIGLTVYMCCMSSLYNVTMRQLIVGSFKLYFSDFFLATGVIILSLSPIILVSLTDYAIAHLVGYFLIFALLLGVMIIPPFLVCQHSFDRVINKKDYPDYYGRGLSYGTYENMEKAKSDESLVEKAENNEIETDFERVIDEHN